VTRIGSVGGGDVRVSGAEKAPAVQVESVAVSYRIRIDQQSLARDVRRLLRRGRGAEREVPALRDVSFAVPAGSVMAVIGRNGAGKSTLLRVIAGILPPEQGRVVVRGRMNLLAPGVGFNPSLTGRENIVLGGLAAGMTRERLDEVAAEIADFAELGEYLDYPLTSYSSGMRARLSFSVAAHLDPEILLIDEALSAGDTGFADKVGDKMATMCSAGRTVVLVTHGLSSVRRMATHAVWLHQGRVAAAGDPEEAVAKYLRFCRLEHLDLDNDGA
jgi:ABC-type polysaccharide/polyol phosphate transport system ATPase subunit